MNEPSEGGASDRQRSLDQYRKVVAGYDRHMWFARRARQEAVGRLLLRPDTPWSTLAAEPGSASG